MKKSTAILSFLLALTLLSAGCTDRRQEKVKLSYKDLNKIYAGNIKEDAEEICDILSEKARSYVDRGYTLADTEGFYGFYAYKDTEEKDGSITRDIVQVFEATAEEFNKICMSNDGRYEATDDSNKKIYKIKDYDMDKDELYWAFAYEEDTSLVTYVCTIDLGQSSNII